jgi:hypothetical protein
MVVSKPETKEIRDRRPTWDLAKNKAGQHTSLCVVDCLKICNPGVPGYVHTGRN